MHQSNIDFFSKFFYRHSTFSIATLQSPSRLILKQVL